jgi:hypothetical protein
MTSVVAGIVLIAFGIGCFAVNVNVVHKSGHIDNFDKGFGLFSIAMILVGILKLVFA